MISSVVSTGVPWAELMPMRASPDVVARPMEIAIQVRPAIKSKLTYVDAGFLDLPHHPPPSHERVESEVVCMLLKKLLKINNLLWVRHYPPALIYTPVPGTGFFMLCQGPVVGGLEGAELTGVRC